MKTRWIPDSVGVSTGKECGEYQVTEAFGVRYLLADENGEVLGREHHDRDDPRHGPLGEGITETLYSFAEITFYGEAKSSDFYGDGFPEHDGVAFDTDRQPIVVVTCQVEKMVFTMSGQKEFDVVNYQGDWDERDGDYEYSELDVELGYWDPELYAPQERIELAFAAAEHEAKTRAEAYASDPDLFNRDIGWDGLAPWERSN
jgi:hypothetical protein